MVRLKDEIQTQVALKQVGFDYNGRGITFQGDLDPGEEPIPKDKLEVYHSAADEEIIIRQSLFYHVLYDYILEWKKIASNPSRFSPGLKKLKQFKQQSAIIKIEEIQSMEKLSMKREKIFDGPQSKFLSFEKQLDLDEASLVISSAHFGENSLNGLKEKLAPSIFQEIVSDCEFKESALLKLFKSPEDHKAY